jgi:hypothetical protein
LTATIQNCFQNGTLESSTARRTSFQLPDFAALGTLASAANPNRLDRKSDFAALAPGTAAVWTIGEPLPPTRSRSAGSAFVTSRVTQQQHVLRPKFGVSLKGSSPACLSAVHALSRAELLEFLIQRTISEPEAQRNTRNIRNTSCQEQESESTMRSAAWVEPSARRTLSDLSHSDLCIAEFATTNCKSFSSSSLSSLSPQQQQRLVLGAPEMSLPRALRLILSRTMELNKGLASKTDRDDPMRRHARMRELLDLYSSLRALSH